MRKILTAGTNDAEKFDQNQRVHANNRPINAPINSIRLTVHLYKVALFNWPKMSKDRFKLIYLDRIKTIIASGVFAYLPLSHWKTAIQTLNLIWTFPTRRCCGENKTLTEQESMSEKSFYISELWGTNTRAVKQSGCRCKETKTAEILYHVRRGRKTIRSFGGISAIPDTGCRSLALGTRYQGHHKIPGGCRSEK